MKGMTKQLLDDVADKEPVITNKRRREENKDRLLAWSPKEECVSFTSSSIQIMIQWVIGSDLYHPTAAGSPVTAVKQVLRVGTQRLLTNKPSCRGGPPHPLYPLPHPHTGRLPYNVSSSTTSYSLPYSPTLRRNTSYFCNQVGSHVAVLVCSIFLITFSASTVYLSYKQSRLWHVRL